MKLLDMMDLVSPPMRIRAVRDDEKRGIEFRVLDYRRRDTPAIVKDYMNREVVGVGALDRFLLAVVVKGGSAR